MAHVCVHEDGHGGIQAENDGPAPHSRLSAGCGEALNPAAFARVSRRYRPVSGHHVMWSLHTHGLPEAQHRESPRFERVCTHSDCTSIEVRNVRGITAIGGLVEPISAILLRTAVSVPIFYVFRGDTSLTDSSSSTVTLQSRPIRAYLGPPPQPIMTSRLGSLALVFELLFSICGAVDNGLARTPAMGWVSSFLIGHGARVRVRLAHFAQNNWNTFGCKVSESLLLETASVLVETGLRDLGYQYVVLDDCWSHGRGEDGYLLADPQKFPRGMKAVAQLLHDNGLLFGMYSSAGELTCARYGELHAVDLCHFGLTPCSGLAGL